MERKSTVSTIAMILIIAICASVYFGIRLFYDPLSRCEWQVSGVFDMEPFPHLSHCEQTLKDESHDDHYYDIAKPIDVVCTASKGVIVFEDRSTGKTYEGVYIKSKRIFNKYSSDYKIVFGELEGNIDIVKGKNVANITIDNKIITISATEN
jgi:hypothetical protein